MKIELTMKEITLIALAMPVFAEAVSKETIPKEFLDILVSPGRFTTENYKKMIDIDCRELFDKFTNLALNKE